MYLQVWNYGSVNDFKKKKKKKIYFIVPFVLGIIKILFI